MIIRSQDKKSITTDLKLHISECDFETDNITYRIYTSTHDWLGTYSTEEKAIKVLDMIQKAYCKARLNECVTSGTFTDLLGMDAAMQKEATKALKNVYAFDMPSDEEVEV